LTFVFSAHFTTQAIMGMISGDELRMAGPNWLESNVTLREALRRNGKVDTSAAEAAFFGLRQRRG
jgi:hypothetical protein